MRLLNQFLIKIYLKYLFVILLSLELFFVGIDFIQNSKSISTANLKILYIAYNFVYALNFTLSISIILAFIVTAITLVRTNYLVALYSCGYSKQDVLKPLFLSALSVTFLYIGLNFTEFAYSKEQVDSIRENQYIGDSRNSLFLKYDNYYVFFSKLYPLQKKAQDVEIFIVENQNLAKIIRAKEAIFLENRWHIDSAIVTEKPKDINQDSKLTTTTQNNLDILHGFKPKIIDNVYDGKSSFSIIDAIEAMKLLNSQNISTEKIKSVLLSITIFPFFAPLFVVLIFYFIPTPNRTFNILIFSSSAIFISLGIWGILFTLVKLSISGVLIAEISIILPIFILTLIAMILYFRISK